MNRLKNNKSNLLIFKIKQHAYQQSEDEIEALEEINELPS